MQETQNEYNKLKDIFILFLLVILSVQNISQNMRMDIQENYTDKMFDILEERQTQDYESNIFQYKILNYLLIQETLRKINEN